MSIQKPLIVVTVVNLGLLMFLLGQVRSVAAQRVEPVLRGRALEIVDDQGRVRASIKVQPPDDAHKTSDGRTYPETVILRLIDSNGRPGVKLTTSTQGGAALLLMTDSDSAYVLLDALGEEPSVKLTTREGRQQLIKPEKP